MLSKYQHYKQAAEQLCISQPGLSHAIASLEEEIGLPLFQKRGRNIVLTQYGKMLQKDAEKIVALIEKSRRSFDDILDGGGTLHLTGTTRLASYLLPRLVKEFQIAFPNSTGKFQFSSGMTPEVIQGVHDGRFDMGFCFKDVWKSDLEVYPFENQRMVVLVNYDHPLSKKNFVTLKETFEYPHIIFSQTSVLRPSMDAFFALIDDFPTVAYEVEQDVMISEMVSCGFGVAVMPEFPSVERHNVISIPIISPAWENTFYLIRRKEDFHSPLEEQFFDFCMKKINHRS